MQSTKTVVHARLVNTVCPTVFPFVAHTSVSSVCNRRQSGALPDDIRGRCHATENGPLWPFFRDRADAVGRKFCPDRKADHAHCRSTAQRPVIVDRHESQELMSGVIDCIKYECTYQQAS